MRYLITLILLCATQLVEAQTCNPAAGNVVIYTNYDGGILNINCDQNIPNLKIGIVTYEDAQINIVGPFAGNVTQVIYAGFQGNNNHCNFNLSTTSITGVNPAITSVLFAPPGVLADGNGNSSIICAYSCDNDNQGGCNTSDQIVAYFLNQMGGSLHSYVTQYGCWFNTTFNISDNNCCGVSNPTPVIEVDIAVSDPIICIGQCVDFTSDVSGNPSTYAWTFTGSTTPTSSSANPSSICYLTPGTYSASLTASNPNTSGSASLNVTVIACGIPGCTYPDALNYDAAATVDDLSCEFDCETASACVADLNGDGIINTGDLTVFLGSFGTICN
jgi:hypothetical protein